MTDYHPVTKEELAIIKNDCAYPKKPYCEGCVYYNKDKDITRDSGFGCQFKGTNALMNKVIARPDPLEVLIKWREHSVGDTRHLSLYEIEKEDEIIKALRTNPGAVINRGKEEGWLE
jgi:hypothetical protein